MTYYLILIHLFLLFVCLSLLFYVFLAGVVTEPVKESNICFGSERTSSMKESCSMLEMTKDSVQCHQVACNHSYQFLCKQG